MSACHLIKVDVLLSSREIDENALVQQCSQVSISMLANQPACYALYIGAPKRVIMVHSPHMWLGA